MKTFRVYFLFQNNKAKQNLISSDSHKYWCHSSISYPMSLTHVDDKSISENASGHDNLYEKTQILSKILKSE